MRRAPRAPVRAKASRPPDSVVVHRFAQPFADGHIGAPDRHLRCMNVLRPIVVAALALQLASCSSAPSKMTKSSGMSSSATPGSASSGPAHAESARAGGQAASCEALTRTDCMKSRSCTLVSKTPGARDGQYACRAAQGPCEEGVAQFDLPGGGAQIPTRELGDAAIRSCTSRAACEYEAGDCYCAARGYGRTVVEDGPEAEEWLCFCSGGAPPACRAGRA